ncbi:pseudouridine synthase [Novosphingopyxis sp.]|uniref:pseudouridine synthase n=1 Tax=Novosphingopyxis sp. TaxID=2709690 RepID=UPI003B5A3B0D
MNDGRKQNSGDRTKRPPDRARDAKRPPPKRGTKASAKPANPPSDALATGKAAPDKPKSGKMTGRLGAWSPVAGPKGAEGGGPGGAGKDESRIAKLLARAGVASRREVERMIAEGRVAINGKVLDTPATLLRDLGGVTVDGRPVGAAEPPRLFAYHKPSGLLTAARDPMGRPTIYDKLPPGLPRLMPVGRLDLNTEGLLLLTNDGELKRLMELPKTGIERTYRARAFGDISQEQLEGLIEGIEIEGMRYGRIDANLERRTGRNQWIEMTLTEGKNREVRNVLEHLGLQVSRLIRTRYGPFTIGDLKAGDVSEIKKADLERFVKSLA